MSGHAGRQNAIGHSHHIPEYHGSHALLVHGMTEGAAQVSVIERGSGGVKADEIEAELFHMGKTEIPSAVIGDMVMARLKKLDHIAYLRFASVYREFADITMLKEEIDTLSGYMAAPPADQLPLIPPEELVETLKTQRRRQS